MTPIETLTKAIEDGFATPGVLPVKGKFHIELNSETVCCCALGAAELALGIPPETANVTLAISEKIPGLQRNFLTGIIHGFDSGKDPGIGTDEEYARGVTYGKKLNDKYKPRFYKEIECAHEKRKGRVAKSDS